jgi:hypothetical protein
MGILGGLDVGFGANMQIVRTNYLVCKTAGAGTTQQYANFLTLFNRVMTENARGNNGLACDYIIAAHAPSDASTNDDPKVIETALASLTDVPVIGQANPDSNQDTNHGVISVLSVGAVEFTNATLTAGAAVASAVDANADLANSNLLLDLVGASATDGATTGVVKTVNIGGLLSDINTALATTITLADTDLSTGFVEKGNASAASATELSNLTIGADSVAVVSVTALVGAGFM